MLNKEGKPFDIIVRIVSCTSDDQYRAEIILADDEQVYRISDSIQGLMGGVRSLVVEYIENNAEKKKCDDCCIGLEVIGDYKFRYHVFESTKNCFSSIDTYAYCPDCGCKLKEGIK